MFTMCLSFLSILFLFDEPSPGPFLLVHTDPVRTQTFSNGMSLNMCMVVIYLPGARFLNMIELAVILLFNLIIRQSLNLTLSYRKC